MGRLKGSKPKPGSKKTGPEAGRNKINKIVSPELVLEAKVAILECIAAGKALTLSKAAELCGYTPFQAYAWSKRDKDFAELVRLAREVMADSIEEEFRNHNNFIPKMMLLKGYRPMFRDNYKIEVSSEGLENLLKELREAGKPKNVTDS